MRWLPLCAVALAAAPAAADAPRAPFWREVADPHGAEVQTMLALARGSLSALEGSAAQDADWAVEQRARLYGDLLGPLRYTHALAPGNAEAAALLAHVADELGRTAEARAALVDAIDAVGRDRAGPELTGHLGAIELRLGHRDEGVRWLRAAAAPNALASPAGALALVHLATALAARGQIADATDALVHALPAQPSFFGGEVALVTFALAVLYDRDEQPAAAFEQLDKLRTQLGGDYGAMLQRELVQARLEPPEDAHYYRALLYESLGAAPEARAEWAQYAAVTDAPWRARALAHLHALNGGAR